MKITRKNNPRRLCHSLALSTGILCILPVLSVSAQTAHTKTPGLPQTLVKEARASIDRGVKYLLEQQKENGSWRNMTSMTGLAVMALHGSNSERYPEQVDKAVKQGRSFIISHVRDSGAIAAKREKYLNYATSICLTALATLDNPEDRDIMRKAREFLLHMQLDEDHPQYEVSEDDPAYGGWAYGSGEPEKPSPNLSTTQFALQALYVTQYLDVETSGDKGQTSRESDLAWDKALDFLKEVQDLPASADKKWVATKLQESKKYDGGFYYTPNESKVNEKLESQDQEDVQGGLRSYGSMTYAGLKSMIYAEVDNDDPRVQAATEWARKHYTLDENPVMGPEGHYYYLQTFAKAFSVLDKEKIVTDEGKTRYWRLDLVKKLLELQKGDGHWVNEKHGRWMESIPELVTSYALLAMEGALGGQL